MAPEPENTSAPNEPQTPPTPTAPVPAQLPQEPAENLPSIKAPSKAVNTKILKDHQKAMQRLEELQGSLIGGEKAGREGGEGRGGEGGIGRGEGRERGGREGGEGREGKGRREREGTEGGRDGRRGEEGERGEGGRESFTLSYYNTQLMRHSRSSSKSDSVLLRSGKSNWKKLLLSSMTTRMYWRGSSTH